MSKIRELDFNKKRKLNFDKRSVGNFLLNNAIYLVIILLRSEEHTLELHSHSEIWYAAFSLKTNTP